MAFTSLVQASAATVWVNVTSYLSVGRVAGTTDDRAGIISAIAAAVAANGILFFPPGLYRVSKYVDILGAVGLHIWGNNARISYPSDDTSVTTDAVATSNNMARGCFLLRYCSDVTIEGITFRGGDHPSLLQNAGPGVYCTRSVNTTLLGCHAVGGHSLVYHDAATAPTNGTGDSLTVASGVVTLVDSAGLFKAGHTAPRQITISNATNPVNNGTFPIKAYVSTTTITYEHANAVSEPSSSFRWAIDDDDRGLRVRGGTSTNCRLYLAPTNDTVIDGHTFRHPDHNEIFAVGGEFSLSGSTITFKTWHPRVGPSLIGKYIRVVGATTGGNNGTFLITGVTAPNGNTSVGTITWTNASGASELYTGNWWVLGGERHGLGGGVGAIAKSGTTVTFTAATSTFHSSDVGKSIMLTEATSASNRDFSLTIGTYISPTQVTWQSSGMVAEDYSGVFLIDGFDRADNVTGGYGSSHAFYMFAGRSNVKVVNCTFVDIRTEAVKCSGSNFPLNDLHVEGCTFVRCGMVGAWGADDGQQHNNLSFVGNTVIDCATTRSTGGFALNILGSRNAHPIKNKFHYTQNSYSSRDGGTPSGIGGIEIERYNANGLGQPCEVVDCSGNEFTCDPQHTKFDQVIQCAIFAQRVGERATFATSGTVTKSGNTCTLTVVKASGQWVGRTVEIVNATSAGNNGSFVITGVPNTTSITYENASGVAEALGGTWRIHPANRAGSNNGIEDMGGALRITGNIIDNLCSQGIKTQDCIAPVITGNHLGRVGAIVDTGSLQPLIDDNQWTAVQARTTATIQLTNTAWPLVGSRNRAVNTNHFSTTNSGRDVVIGIGATPADFPLLGFRGRAKATDGYEQVVVAYGSRHVDGDTIGVAGTTLTYKASSPGANQFNSQATLITAINAIAGVSAEDYGTPWSLTTGHIRIYNDARTTADGSLQVGSKTLNPNALVVLRNNDGVTGTAMFGRGAASVGPIPDKFVLWSPLAGHTAVLGVEADNETARALLESGLGAQGLITCVAKASLADTDYMTIGDGLSAPKLYEFDTAGDGVTAGRVQVNVSTDTTAAEVAARLRTAILANQPALSVTDNANGTLTIAHLIPGTVGNVTMTENVANAGFTLAGLSNGAGGGYRHLRNVSDGGSCALIQTAKTTNQANADTGAEIRWVIGA